MRIISSCLFAFSMYMTGAAAQAESNEDILKSIVLHPDFDLELAVREPLVFDPVDLEFDALGRAFVIEMPGYPFPKEEGRVVLLEDSNQDGEWDKRTIFAENFPVATSLMPYKDGLLVASPPDLIFIQDTDGDNVADVREVVLSGLTSDNTQHNFNGLTYGLDNWIYMANGGNTESAHWPNAKDEKLFIGWNDFRIDLEGKRFETIGRTSGGFELAMDDWGRIYETHNMVHISHLLFPGRYLKDLVNTGRDTLVNISDHEENGTSRIFALGEQETRVNHPEQSGYVSGACGTTHYGGGVFPAEFNGNIFVADCVLNLIHRDVLIEDDPAGTAQRGRESIEFIASTDRAFRPVNMTVGPDGALYVLDMHRDVIEHPEWIPDEMEVNMDLDAGRDKGRIFRVVPKVGKLHKVAAYSQDDKDAVIAALSHPNQWNRSTAQRLLVQWQDKDTITGITQELESDIPQGRLHAMYTLHGLKELKPKQLTALLSDPHPGVRENALIVAEHYLDQKSVRKAVYALAQDEHHRVRMFVSLMLGSINRGGWGDEIDAALNTLFDTELTQPWGNLALSTVLGGEPELATATATKLMEKTLEANVKQNDFYARGFLKTVMAQSTATQDPKLLLQTLNRVATASDNAALKEVAIQGLLEGLKKYKRPDTSDAEYFPALSEALAAFESEQDLTLTLAAWELGQYLHAPVSPNQEALLAKAQQVSLDTERPLPERLANLTLLQFAPLVQRVDALFTLLDSRGPRELQQGAAHQISTAGRLPEAQRLLALWDELGPASRSIAVDFLLRKAFNHDLLLTALENRDIAIGQMRFDLERRRYLLWNKNEDTAARAAKLFNDAGVVTRSEALEKMRPALTMAGDPVRGKQVYLDTCATCHILGNEGTAVGPSLTDISRKSKETLLHDILDPNAAVNSEFIGYTLEIDTEDVFAEETTFSGIIVADTDSEVTIRLADGVEHTFNRNTLKSMRSSGLSLMPEELESGMEVQHFEDLLSYLQEAK